MNQELYNTSLEEQETQVNIDYYKRNTQVYTSNKTIYKRIQNKIGEPNKIHTINGKITGGFWIIPFSYKKNLTSILSRPLLIGNRK